MTDLGLYTFKSWFHRGPNCTHQCQIHYRRRFAFSVGLRLYSDSCEAFFEVFLQLHLTPYPPALFPDLVKLLIGYAGSADVRTLSPQLQVCLTLAYGLLTVI